MCKINNKIERSIENDNFYLKRYKFFSRFVYKYVVFGKDQKTTRQEIYNAYLKFCEDNKNLIMCENTFFSNFKKAVKNIANFDFYCDTQNKFRGIGVVGTYSGIGIKIPVLKEIFEDVDNDLSLDNMYKNEKEESGCVDNGIAKEPLILESEDWATWQWMVLLKIFGLEEAERIKISDYYLKYYGIEKDWPYKEPNKLDESIRRQIIIKTQSHEEKYRIANKIHEQLVGNQDYVDNRIVLNLSSDILDDNYGNEVYLYIFNESETDPDIRI